MLGVNSKHNATKREFGEDHPLEQLKVTVTQIDHKSPSRWNRKICTTAPVAASAQTEALSMPEQPATRNPSCISCKGSIDVQHKQLHVKDGHRVIQCPHCRWQGRTTLQDCESVKKRYLC